MTGHTGFACPRPENYRPTYTCIYKGKARLLMGLLTYGAPCVGPTGVKGADDTGVDAPGAPAARDAPVAAAGGGG